MANLYGCEFAYEQAKWGLIIDAESQAEAENQLRALRKAEVVEKVEDSLVKVDGIEYCDYLCQYYDEEADDTMELVLAATSAEDCQRKLYFASYGYVIGQLKGVVSYDNFLQKWLACIYVRIRCWIGNHQSMHWRM